MKTKFTNGLMVIYPSVNEPDKFDIADMDGVCYAHVYGANGTVEEMEEAEANAKLIAAAPDLFKALQLIIDRVENGWDTFAKPEQNGLKSAFILEATEAIKKATA
jgi:hypothetical protein